MRGYGVTRYGEGSAARIDGYIVFNFSSFEDTLYKITHEYKWKLNKVVTCPSEGGMNTCCNLLT